MDGDTNHIFGYVTGAIARSGGVNSFEPQNPEEKKMAEKLAEIDLLEPFQTPEGASAFKVTKRGKLLANQRHQALISSQGHGWTSMRLMGVHGEMYVKDMSDHVDIAVNRGSHCFAVPLTKLGNAKFGDEEHPYVQSSNGRYKLHDNALAFPGARLDPNETVDVDQAALEAGRDIIRKNSNKEKKRRRLGG